MAGPDGTETDVAGSARADMTGADAIRPVRRAAALVAAVGLLALGAATATSAAPAAANATGTIGCPGATSGKADGGNVAGGACAKSVTGAAADGTVTVAGAITYTACGGLLQRSCSSATFAVTPPKGSSQKAPASAGLAEKDGGSSAAAAIVLPASSDNGVWTAAVTGDGANATATFTLQIPPTAPGTPKIDTSTAAQATVTWAVSAPTAASGYALQVDGNATTVAPDCSTGGSCSGTVTGLGGGKHTFTVVASRSDGAGGSLTSSSSADATVTAAPASPSPSPSPTGSTGTGTTGGGTKGGTSSGGSTGTVVGGGSKGGTTASGGSTGLTAAQLAAAAAAQHRAATSFQSFAPPSGIAQLPPLPKFPTSASGNGEPTDPGTYVPTLPYDGSRTVIEQYTKTNALGDVAHAFSNRTLLASVAGAGLVLLVAAHLLTFLRRDPLADL